MKPVNAEWHNEDRIETAFRAWLLSNRWQVPARPSQTGTDITATDPHGAAWLFEVKGYPATFYKGDGSAKPKSSIRNQRRVWFIEALGQIITRMTETSSCYGLVFPDNPVDSYFERQSLLIPPAVRTKLNLWVFLISQSSTVRELLPHANQFEDWSSHAHSPAGFPG
jgi:hypothetical protein